MSAWQAGSWPGGRATDCHPQSRGRRDRQRHPRQHRPRWRAWPDAGAGRCAAKKSQQRRACAGFPSASCHPISETSPSIAAALCLSQLSSHLGGIREGACGRRLDWIGTSTLPSAACPFVAASNRKVRSTAGYHCGQVAAEDVDEDFAGRTPIGDRPSCCLRVSAERREPSASRTIHCFMRAPATAELGDGDTRGDRMKVVFGRKRIDFATLEADADFQRLREPVVMVGTGLPERGAAFAFRDWKVLLKFSQRTKAADKVAAIDERRRKLSRRSGEDMTAISERHRRKVARIEADLREFAERTGLALDSNLCRHS